MPHRPFRLISIIIPLFLLVFITAGIWFLQNPSLSFDLRQQASGEAACAGRSHDSCNNGCSWTANYTDCSNNDCNHSGCSRSSTICGDYAPNDCPSGCTITYDDRDCAFQGSTCPGGCTYTAGRTSSCTGSATTNGFCMTHTNQDGCQDSQYNCTWHATVPATCTGQYHLPNGCAGVVQGDCHGRYENGGSCSGTPNCTPGRNWSTWGTCSLSCGGGTQSRTDDCGNSESRPCNTQACSTATNPPGVSCYLNTYDCSQVNRVPASGCVSCPSGTSVCCGGIKPPPSPSPTLVPSPTPSMSPSPSPSPSVTSTPTPSPTNAAGISCYPNTYDCSMVNRYPATGCVSCPYGTSVCCGARLPVPSPSPSPSPTPSPNSSTAPSCHFGPSSCSSINLYSATGCSSCPAGTAVCCGGPLPANAFVCTANEHECVDSTHVRSCSSDRLSWLPTTPCVSGYTCNSATGFCEPPPKVADNGHCNENNDCQSNNCQLAPGGKICRPAGTFIIAQDRGLGESCNTYSQCATNFACVSGTCQLPPSPTPLSVAGVVLPGNSTLVIDYQPFAAACAGKTSGELCMVNNHYGACEGGEPLLCNTSGIITPNQVGADISASAESNGYNQVDQALINTAGEAITHVTNDLSVFTTLAVRNPHDLSPAEALTELYAAGDLATLGGLSATTNAAVNWREKCWNSSSTDPECLAAAAQAGVAGTFAATGITGFTPETIVDAPFSSTFDAVFGSSKGTTFGSEAMLTSGGGTYVSSNNGQRLVIDPSKDVRLQQYIRDSEKYLQINRGDTTSRAEALTSYVNESLRYADPSQTSSGATYIRSQLYSQQQAPTLGQFVEGRAGVCREFAACLHVTLANAGKENYMVVGDVQELAIPGVRSAVKDPGGVHAWVEYVDTKTGQWMVADPTNNFVMNRAQAYSEAFGGVTNATQRAFVYPGNTSFTSRMVDQLKLKFGQ